MPVIGRLDGQVDEVIIKPISRRRDEEEETHVPPQTSDDTPSHTPPSDESSANTDELPVWLL
ncbi:MAG: hypothetical protein JOZ96_23535 [Acidobacteria bacterium]|nr:hypothetical protein [Acidobacteriota bacterium]